jgi:hypothetical protein
MFDEGDAPDIHCRCANPYLFKQAIQDRATGWVKFGVQA